MTLWVRTEASERIGMGHFMRCFAIAEEARLQGLHVTFLTGDMPAQALERLSFAGIDRIYTDLPAGSAEEAAFLKRLVPSGHGLLLDSYAFGADYYQQLYDTHFVVVMDDEARVRPLKAHVVVNATLSAPDMGYGVIAPEARRLLGPAYAQIRHEFRRAYPDPVRPHIGVTFGGSDPANLTAAVALTLMAAHPDIDIRLIAGPANAHVDDLRHLCREHARLKLYLSPDNVAEVLYGADMVVTAAGGSVYEVAAMGLPALVLVVADNQAAVLRACPYPALDARNGLPDIFMSWVEAALRNVDIGISARELVDGQGCVRILQAMPI